MNRRERIMVGALVAVGLLFAGRAGWRGYFAKLQSLDEEIARKQKESDKIVSEQLREQKGRVAWIKAGKQTLATDANQAQTLLRDELYRLSTQTGLANANIQLQGVRLLSRKTGIKALNCTVTGEGTLAHIVKFFFELHRQPYQLRFKRLVLGRPKGKDVPIERLTIKLDLDTLILPEGPGLPPVQPVDLAGGQREPTSRPVNPTIEGYAELIKKKLFEPYTPPIPPPTKVVARTPTSGSQNVPVAASLMWNPAANGKKYEVYFSSEGPEKLQLVATLEGGTTWKPPGNLDLEKPYWWRVDASNDQGKTEGDVWTFTTVKSAPVVTEKIDIPPPPPPKYNDFILSRIISSPLTQQVVLENPRDKADTRVELGEEMYNGKLVLIHPRGAVSDSKENDQLWFHAITQPLLNARPLSRIEQPEVYEAYEQQLKLSEPAAGISQAGG